MPRSEFRTISLPQSYYQQLEEYIEQSNGYYASISEVVRGALRKFFARITSHRVHIRRPIKNAGCHKVIDPPPR